MLGGNVVMQILLSQRVIRSSSNFVQQEKRQRQWPVEVSCGEYAYTGYQLAEQDRFLLAHQVAQNVGGERCANHYAQYGGHKHVAQRRFIW